MSLEQELAQLTPEFKSVEETRRELGEFCQFMQNIKGQKEDFIPTMGELRKIKPETLIALGGFMMNEEFTPMIPKKFRDYALGIFKGDRNLFEGRFVFPVYDVHKQVEGLVGWDIEGYPKYLDSKNFGYKSKHSGFFGMQNLREYYEKGKVIVCEGPLCAVYMLENGLPAMSSLGSELRPYMITILKRFEDNCLVIPDGHFDQAGKHYRRQVEKVLPMARVVQPTKAKDIDDTRLWLREKKGLEADKIIANELRNLLENHFYESEYFM